jgi:hypothetical protein
MARDAGKLHVVSFSGDLTVPFTFWAGVIGGAFLTTASHGTDQLLVQRLLTCRNLRDSQRALIMSGVIVLLQFVLFLTIGLMLFGYYQATGAPSLTSTDEVFPTFIVQHLPHGISGLVIAAIFAAAMSNLSGSLNSLASTTIIDFYQPRGASLERSAAAVRLALVHGRVGHRPHRHRDARAALGIGLHVRIDDRVARLRPHARRVPARGVDPTSLAARRDDRYDGVARLHAARQELHVAGLT